MKLFENQTFQGIQDRNSGKTFSDFEFRKCRFISCLFISLDPKTRPILRGVKLENCEEISSTLRGAIVEDVSVDGLKSSGGMAGLFTWSTVFKHVVLKGKIQRVVLKPLIAATGTTKEQQQAFDKANDLYYSTVDWALDISQGEFKECQIEGIPAQLIRRDPETQVVVTRAKAALREWQKLDLSKTHWATSLAFLLSGRDQDVVLVAPKRSKKFRDLLAGIKLLREAGVAEPD
jgi:hypothetical protein